MPYRSKREPASMLPEVGVMVIEVIAAVFDHKPASAAILDCPSVVVLFSSTLVALIGLFVLPA